MAGTDLDADSLALAHGMHTGIRPLGVRRSTTSSRNPARMDQPREPGRTKLPCALAVILAIAFPSVVHSEGLDAQGSPERNGRCYPAATGRLACYETPGVFGFLLNVPGDIGSLFVDGLRRDNLPAFGGMMAATAGLIALDQRFVDGAQRAGRWAGVASNDDTRKVPGLSLPYPADLGAGLYYIGDGMVPVTIALGMLGYGLTTSDVRALQTTSQLVEGMLSVGIVVQGVKHLSGRETPNRATTAGGAWRPAPSVRDYHKDVPSFDAFPSGHMATAMMTLTVLSENYPEYWLMRPVGYGLMTLLAFQMMNNGVHWASDYPLAIAVGYGLGKRAVANGRRLVRAADPGAPAESESQGLSLLPIPLARGGGLSVTGRF